MENSFSQNVKVLSSMTDANAEVGISYALSYLQDNMSEFFGMLGCDGISMIPDCHAFWVMTKTKIKFYSTPHWLDKITLETTLQKLTPARLNLSNNILDQDGNILIGGLQEICAMDSDSRKIRLVKTTTFPSEILPSNSTQTLEFSKLDFDIDGESQREALIDGFKIDYFGHTNNVEYARILMSTFAGEELKKLKPRSFEIHYISESKEGETLRIYREKMDNNYLFVVKNDDKLICKALLEL